MNYPNKFFEIVGLCFALLLSSSLFAQGDKPAVDGVNGKAEILGQSSEGDNGGYLLGSLSIPLGHSFGLQLDGAYGRVDGHKYEGLGAHVFYRDPDEYLVGALAYSVDHRGIDVDRYGVEFERYIDNWTYGGHVGVQKGDMPDDHFYGAFATYYPHDDLAIEIGIDGHDDNKNLNVGADWQFQSNWALTAQGSAGDDDESVLLGVRYYFGKDKSLKRRMREDDPDNPLIKPSGFIEPEETPVVHVF